MGLPRILKKMMLFNEGAAYLGEVTSVTLPTLSRALEEFRGAGMSGTVNIDMGMEAMEMSFSAPGPLRDVIRQWGVPTIDGVYLRFAGAYQQDDTAAVDTVEVIVRGRFNEIDMGDQSVGEVGEFSPTMQLAYYKLDWNGRTEIEIDPIAGIEIVNGIDRTAALRAAIGLN